MELYIYEFGINESYEEKLKFIYKEIEYYHFVFIEEEINQNILTFVEELLTTYNHNLFDWPGNNYFSSIGQNILYLESFKLTETDWDFIISLALKHKLHVFNDEKKEFY